MRKLIILSVLSILFIGCSETDNSNTPPKPKKPKTETEYRYAKFSSMDGCLQGLEKETKLPLTVAIDKPNEVTGMLGNTNRTFVCQVTETGSEGTYVKGWYAIEVEVY